MWSPSKPHADKQDDGNELSTGAIAGISVGSAVFVMMLFALIGLLLYRRRRARKSVQKLRSENGSATLTANSQNDYSEDYKFDGMTNPSELCAQAEQQADSRPIFEADAGYKGINVDSSPVYEIGISKNAHGY